MERLQPAFATAYHEDHFRCRLLVIECHEISGGQHASTAIRSPKPKHSSISIARTVRRTILLAQQLDAPPRSRLNRDAIRTAARRKIIRAVDDAIQRPFEDPA